MQVKTINENNVSFTFMKPKQRKFVIIGSLDNNLFDVIKSRLRESVYLCPLNSTDS